jgi:WD40 repeat protein
LIRQWRQLEDWTNDEEKAHQTARVVAGEMRNWQKRGRDKGGLLPELRTLEAEEWAKTHPHQVQPEVQDFLKASRDQLDRERRRWRVVSWVLGALAAFLLILVALAVRAEFDAKHDRDRAQAAEFDAKHDRDRAQEAEQVANLAAGRAQAAEKVATDERDRAKNEAAKSAELLRQNLETRARGLASASRRILKQDPAGALTLAVQAKRMTDEKTVQPPDEVERSLLSAIASQREVPPLATLFPSSNQKVRAIQFSPDGRWLVTGGVGTAAHLWRFEPGPRPLTPVVLDGHTESVDMVAVSSGDPRIATLDHEGKIRLWGPKSVDHSPQSVLLKGAVAKANVIALSGDGRWLASGGQNGEAWLWSLKNPDHPAAPERLIGHFQEILALAFDPDGNRLVTADKSAMVQLWNLAASPATREALGIGYGSSGTYTVAFSPDGRRLAAADFPVSARLWNLGQGNPGVPMVLRTEGSSLVTVAFSPQGRVATADQTGVVRLWEASASIAAAPSHVLRTMGGSIGKLVFSSQAGRWLGAMDFWGRVWLWDVGGISPARVSLMDANAHWTPDTWPKLPAQVGGFAFHPDGGSLVTVDGKGGVQVWDLSKFETAPPFDPLNPSSRGGAWSRTVLGQPSGSVTEVSVGVGSNGDSQLWTSAQADTSAAIVELTTKAPNSTTVLTTTHLAAAAFCPDGRTVALPGPDGSIKLWDAAGSMGSAVKILAGRAGQEIQILAFSPVYPGARRWLASGAKTGIIKLWDLDARDPIAPAAELGGQDGEILSLAFSPDGRWLVAGSEGPARQWDLKNGPPFKPVKLPGNPGTATRALAFHPTATDWLAIGGSDGQILLWKLSNDPIKDSPRHLPSHRGSITRLAFTPDGRRLISTSEDGTARRWAFDPRDPGSRVVEKARHFGSVTCLAISHDAARRWLATGGASGDVRICRLDDEVFESRPIPPDGNHGSIVDLAFSGDGRRLAISSEDMSVRVVMIDDTGHVSDSPILLGGDDEVTTSLMLDPSGRLLIASGPRGMARFWPLKWSSGLDQVAAQFAIRNLSSDEWDQHFSKEGYRKTFGHLPVHQSLFDAARSLAKQGQRDEALRRLRQLRAIDHRTEIDAKADVDRSVAEGIIENGRHLAKNGEKDQAIGQFLAACKLVPAIVADPLKEFDKYEAMGRKEADTDEAKAVIAAVDGLIKNIRETHNRPPQGQPRIKSAEEGADTRDSLLGDARLRYAKLKTLNENGNLGLMDEIQKIGRHLTALDNDREAQRRAEEGKIDEAVKRYKEAVKQAPEFFTYVPEAIARQVASERARIAYENGRRMVSEKKTKEAIREFELARTLAPQFYTDPPETLVQRLTSEEAATADLNGRQLAAEGKLQEAIKALSKAHDLDKSKFGYNPVDEADKAVRDAKIWQADKRLQELVDHTKHGQYDQAKAMFKQAQLLDPGLKIEPQQYVDQVHARLLVQDGIQLILNQSFQNMQMLELKDSLQKFREAKALDPKLEFDPERLANLHASRIWLIRANTLSTYNPKEARAALEKAKSLLVGLEPRQPNQLATPKLETPERVLGALSSLRFTLGSSIEAAGIMLCKQGFPDDALALYQHGRDLDPLLSVSAQFWNTLSWHGSLQGVNGAKRLGFASDLALALDPANGDYRDTRGLRRVLEGDQEGAIGDFEAYVWYSTNYRYRQERQEWVRRLRSGTPVEQIFTPEVLNGLKKE